MLGETPTTMGFFQQKMISTWGVKNGGTTIEGNTQISLF